MRTVSKRCLLPSAVSPRTATLALGLLAAVSIAPAADYFWEGPTNGAVWTASSDGWSAGAPAWDSAAVTDTAVFDTNTLTASVSGLVFAGGLTVKKGGVLTVGAGAAVSNLAALALWDRSAIKLESGGRVFAKAGASFVLNSPLQWSTRGVIASTGAAGAGGVLDLNGSTFVTHGYNSLGYTCVVDNVTITNVGALEAHGRGGNFNALILTNYARLYVGGDMALSIDARDNRLTVCPNSVLDLGGRNITMNAGAGGGATPRCSLVIDGGAVTNVGATNFKSDNVSRDAGCIVVTNGGSLFTTNNCAIDCSNGVVAVTGTGSVWNLNNKILRVGNGGIGNSLRVGAGGLVTNVGDLAVIGGNAAVLEAGGRLCAATNGTSYFMLNGDSVSNTRGSISGGGGSAAGGVLDVGKAWFLPAGWNASGYACTLDNVTVTNAAAFEINRGGGSHTLMLTNGASLFCTSCNIGVDGSGNDTLTVSSGSVFNVGAGTLNMHAGGGQNNALLVSGGLVTNVSSVQFAAGNRTRQNSRVVVSAGGRLYTQNDSRIDISNGTVTVTDSGSQWDLNAKRILIGDGGTNNWLRLSSGGLVSRAAVVLSPGPNWISFNGGTLSAGVSGNLISGAGTGLVQSAGACIDTAGFNVTNTVPLAEDPASPGGGLVKLGAGSLTLAAAHAHTGATVVSNGVLRLALPAALSSATEVVVAPGATVDLAFSGTQTVRRLVVGGVLQTVNKPVGAAQLPGSLSGLGYLLPTEGAPPRGTLICVQ